MSKQLNIHVFNCDRTYKLNVVKDWLKAVAKSSNVVFHYFSLSEMTKLSDKTIPGLDEMDVAVFVVQAHESRLSINEENAGIGYAKLYRALLEKTDSRVLIVIGGDDNYKNEDEEDREFISRWARRKISSQFGEEFLNGSKSFVFSWDKRHREIHEKALVHFLSPSKTGQKFEYHPPQRETVTKPTISKGSGLKKSGPPFQLDSSTTVPEGQSAPMKGTEISFDGQRDQGQKTGGISGAGTGSQGAGHQRAIGSTMVSNSLKTSREKLASMERTQIPPREKGPEFSDRGTGRPGIQSQGARPKETSSFTKQPQETNGGLALLGCCVSGEAIYAVERALESISPKLNLQALPPVINHSTANKVKQYLERHSPQFCVLVVDGETVKDAYENLPKQKVEYEDLLKTAVERVAMKVVVLVCGSLFLPEEDEEIIHRTIDDTIKKNEKGFTAWLKNGRLTVDSDVLVQLLNPALVMSCVMPPGGAAQGETNIPSHSFYQRRHLEQPSEIKPGYGWENNNPQQQRVSLPAATPTYNTKPNRVMGKSPQLAYCGDQEIEMADNDLILLKTRVRNGLVSFHEDDIEVRYPADWQVPTHILEDLRKQGSNGKLFIISDEKGNLRSIVKTAVLDRVTGAKNKALACFSSKKGSANKEKFF